MLHTLQEIGRKRRLAEGKDYSDRPDTPVFIGRSSDEGFPYEGRIDYSGLKIDADTGTWEARGIVPNDGELDAIIVPGSFVRVRLPIGNYEGALLVSERALGADQGGRFLLLVNSEDRVEQRHVVVGPRVDDDLRVIEKGLRAEDWVVVTGLQRARPGTQVAPERVDGAGQTTSSGATEGARSLKFLSARTITLR